MALSLHPDRGERLAHRRRIGIVDPFDPARTREHEREPAARLLVARHDREQVVGAQTRAARASAARARATSCSWCATARRVDPLERARELRREHETDRDRLAVQQRVTRSRSRARARACGRS